jgi:diacylglycerol kinase (ATP)
MEPQKISFKKQMAGFKYAFSGIGKFILTERNATLHLVATILVIVLALFFRISINEAIALTVAIGLVWITEMLNTCMEKAMNFISMNEHEEIRFIKDVGAGAVLIASATALAIGLFIFIPKIL